MVYIFEKHFLTCKVYTILIQKLKHKLKSHMYNVKLLPKLNKAIIVMLLNLPTVISK
jgi:hypothetical protein